jgi:hypothetical protein
MSAATFDNRGQCMCGAVTYTVRGQLRDVWNCHCSRCRRWTGHHMAASRAITADVAMAGEVTWFQPGPGAEYGFCATCGSSLFWRSSERPEHISIAAGTLHQPTGLRTTTAWWMAEHADYHEPAEGLVEHEGDG